ALAGDRAGALAQYEAGREVLWSELGLEPSPETVALLEEVKAGRYSRLATDEIIRPPARARHNLPADTTPFIGRELELSQISRLLTHDRQRLVTIVGPGGMGKTRLALAVGTVLLERYEDGVYFVDLAPVDRAEDILQAIAVALDYQAPDRSGALKPQLMTALAQRRLLLILDNFEQVLDGAVHVNEILQTCPQIAILATSRERLHLTGESRYELGGLDFPQEMTAEDALDYTAVRLFAESGRRARPDFEINAGNVADVARICRQVGGMPLALVLAAAWLELLTPAEIAAEIDRGLDFLTVSLSDLPERQRSMQTVFACSWQLMPLEEQSVMAGLSVFRESFTREAAEAVAGANLRVLLALVNKSLLQRRPDSGRFTIHELLRQFAAGQRRRDDPGRQVELAHCHYYVGLVKSELHRLHDLAPTYASVRFTDDTDNIHRAWTYAIEHGLVEEAAVLAGGLYALANAQGVRADTLFEEARQRLAQRGVAETHPAMVRLGYIALLWESGLHEPARVIESALAFVPFAEAHGDPEALLWLYHLIAWLYVLIRDPRCLIWAEKITSAARALDDELYLYGGEAYEAIARITLGRMDSTTLPRLETVLAYLEAISSPPSLVFEVLEALREGFLAVENIEQALHYSTRSLNAAKGWRNLYGISVAAYRLAEMSIQAERPVEAARHLLDALDWHVAIGKGWQTSGCLMSLHISFAPLFGGGERAVPVLSMVYHHPEAIPGFRAQVTAARPQFEAEMGAAAFAAAWERGQALDFDAAVAQTRAALVSVGQG
ncbi:AAA family ATPase, partial [Promineifilum sp.]|uniref:ATP-binding protein n=1 Tax=Promineifilum sp. TaxID=2664178 RepID=UPI0035B13287